jgi:hypothetical protein
MDILLSLKGPKGRGFLRSPVDFAGDFGGFLPRPPYFSGGQRRGFTFGRPAHRSFGRMDFRMRASEGKGENGSYIPGLKRRGFTARLGNSQAF